MLRRRARGRRRSSPSTTMAPASRRRTRVDLRLASAQPQNAVRPGHRHRTRNRQNDRRTCRRRRFARASHRWAAPGSRPACRAKGRFGNARVVDVRPWNATPRFAHRSEAEFARLLDFYQVDWHYEPCSFPISRDECGNAVEWFTPDFYLPQYDLFVEMTVHSPHLQSRKNRKVRLLRQVVPRPCDQILHAARRTANFFDQAGSPS